MKTILSVILFLAGHMCCAQCNDPIVKLLKGVWVRDKQPADTIKFAMSLESEYRFELISAVGSTTPSGLFGFYEFRTLGTTMILRSFLSSYSGAQSIAFFIDKSGQLLTLGNFYGFNTEEKMITFRKLK